MCKKSCSEYVHMPVPADLKGRPIIAGPVAQTQRLSELIEKLFLALVMFLRSFVKDDWEFIRNFPRSVNFECELFPVDIVSLYTNIPHALGVEAVSYYFDKYRDKIPRRFTKEFMIESTLFILNNNNFFFDEVFYHQKEGTAMGTKFAPPYACLSVGYLEETTLYVQLPHNFEAPICELIIRWFLRYIDDGFILWPRGIDIDIFFTILNNLNTNIQLTIEASTKYFKNEYHIQGLPFLDVLVILRDHKYFSTDIFYKETNSHFCLYYNSHHPQHIKDNISYGLAKKSLFSFLMMKGYNLDYNK